MDVDRGLTISYVMNKMEHIVVEGQVEGEGKGNRGSVQRVH